MQLHRAARGQPSEHVALVAQAKRAIRITQVPDHARATRGKVGNSRQVHGKNHSTQPRARQFAQQGLGGDRFGRGKPTIDAGTLLLTNNTTASSSTIRKLKVEQQRRCEILLSRCPLGYKSRQGCASLNKVGCMRRTRTCNKYCTLIRLCTVLYGPIRLLYTFIRLC